jgi:hypothetical protein
MVERSRGCAGGGLLPVVTLALSRGYGLVGWWPADIEVVEAAVGMVVQRCDEAMGRHLDHGWPVGTGGVRGGGSPREEEVVAGSPREEARERWWRQGGAARRQGRPSRPNHTVPLSCALGQPSHKTATLSCPSTHP